MSLINVKNFKCNGESYFSGEVYEGPDADMLKEKGLVGNKEAFDKVDHKIKRRNLKIAEDRQREKKIVKGVEAQTKGRKARKKSAAK